MDNGIRYVGLDVHRDSISVAVLNQAGKLVKEAVIPTQEAALLGWLRELRGPLHVVLEEGTWAAWLYELLSGRVAKVVVCDPRKITRHGNKSDRFDARELADLLRCNRISAVFHWRDGTAQLARTGPYLCGAHQGTNSHHEPHQGSVSQLRHSLRRPELLWA